jgi:regulator of sigma E protease
VSIALGITNLLPLPPLDGGRILFVVIEMVRGKPMSARREELLLMIGVVFLLSVGVLVIINDILNPITNSLIP